MKRSVLVLALLAAALAPACTPRAPKRQEVVFWHHEDAAAVAAAARAFEAATPGVVVTTRRFAPETYADSLRAALAAGRVPDLCELGAADAEAFLRAGQLSDWSAGVADLRDSLRGWPLAMVGDAIYGLPWLLEPQVLLADRDLLARAKVAGGRPPRTWSELAAAAARIHRLGRGIDGYAIALDDSGSVVPAFLVTAWGHGGGVLSAGLDSSQIESPQNAQALALLAKLRASGRPRTAGELRDGFARGTLGLAIAGAGLRAALPKEARARVVLAPVPAAATGEGPGATLATGELLASFSASRRKEDALRLARFLVHFDRARAVSATTPAMQPSAIMTPGLAAPRGPDAILLANQLATARYVPRSREWPAIARALDASVRDAIEGRASAAEAIGFASAALDSLLPGGRRRAP